MLKALTATSDEDLSTSGKAISKISADNVISLPLDPLPSIFLWDKTKIVGDLSYNALQGPFWNLNTWGVRS